MKHRLLVLFFSILLLMAWVPNAFADVLWEPYGDAAYDYEKANTVARIYVVPEGSTVNIYESPTMGGLILTMEAGTRVYVGFTQEFNGVIWGVGYPVGDWQKEGWFRIGRLQQEYDNQMFYADYSETFTDYEGQLDGYVVQDVIPTWTYPGSNQMDGQIAEIHDSYPLSCQYVYTDLNGGLWGYVGYFMGRCGWIYLSDPENPCPPSFPLTAENTVTETGPEQEPNTGLIWIVILVVGLVAATAVIIFVLKRKRRFDA